MDQKKLQKCFVKPTMNTRTGLKRGFIPVEEEANLYIPATVVNNAGEEIFFPDQTLGRVVKTDDGTEVVLSSPFQKGVPASQVSEDALMRARANAYLEQMANVNAALQMQASLPHDAMVQHAPLQIITGTANCDESGTYYTDEKTGECERICNFTLNPQKLMVFLAHEKEERREIRFEVFLGGLVRELSIDIKSLDRLAAVVCEQVLGAAMNNSFAKTDKKLAEKFRKKLRNISEEVHQTLPGWMEWKGRKIFAQDERLRTEEGLCMGTGKAIKSSPMYEADLLEILRAMSSIGPISIMAPMIAASLLGPLHQIFNEANHSFEPHFLLFINGRSGSLKTAVSKVLYNMYNADTPLVPASFRDTPVGVEMRLREYASAPVLLDDFYSTGIRKEHTDMTKILEMVVRYVGDGIGKNRSNSKLQDVKGIRPTGMVVVTGEDTEGQLSTLLRCLILNVDRGTFDGTKLQQFQDEPLRWSTFLAFFVDYLERNYGRLIKQIQSSYIQVRENYKEYFADLRPADQMTQLHIAIEILSEFLMEKRSDKAVEIRALCGECIEGCFKAAILSQEYATQNSGETRYLSTLKMLLFDKTIVVAEKRAVYAENLQEYDGFEDQNYFYLRSDLVYIKIRKYFKDQGRELSVSELNANRALDRAGVLITETENAGTEKEKKFLEVKVKIGDKRPRMLKIIKKALEGGEK